jgi:Ca-activated chloride channel family protein
LRRIAEKTGGAFFRATATDTIESSFEAIDKAKKTEFEARKYVVREERFKWFAVAGLACLSLVSIAAIVRSINGEAQA